MYIEYANNEIIVEQERRSDVWEEYEEEREGKVRVIKIGRVYEKDVAKKYVLGKEVNKFNGAGAVIVIEYPEIKLYTDRMGLYPIFLYRPASNKWVISTSVERIAQRRRVERDEVSMAEFLYQHKITPPFTYYKEINIALPATEHIWNVYTGEYKVKETWRPFEAGFYSSKKKAVQELAYGLEKSIKTRTSKGPIITLISGGLDSRLVAYLSENKTETYAVNLQDRKNYESKVAQKVCEDAGVNYVPWVRDRDYYPAMLREGVKINEGMWSIFDCHFYGLKEFIFSLKAKTVISGCGADFLFKEANNNRVHPQIGCLTMPWFKEDTKCSYIHPSYIDPPMLNVSTKSKYREEMYKRRMNWFNRNYDMESYVKQDRFCDELWLLKLNDRRNRPLSYAGGLSFITNFKSFPYDSFFADPLLINCYEKMPLKWKINGEVWKKAVIELCGERVENANTKLRIGATKAELLINQIAKKPLKVFKSKSKSKFTVEKLETETSWPSFLWYIRNSETIKDIWDSITKEEEVMLVSLLGFEYKKSLANWNKEEERLMFQILTLVSYLRWSSMCNG